MASPEPSASSAIAAVLSYLVPGLGQIVQGRIGKGLLFMVCLLSLFHAGQAMGGWRNVYLPNDDGSAGRGQFRHAPNRNPLIAIKDHRWHYAGQFWIGAAAWPALFHYFGTPLPMAERDPFWADYQSTPEEATQNAFLVNSDKTPDIGLIYTVIAGVLNLLVIYDAFAGPAFPSRKAPSPGEPGASEAA